MLIETIGTVRDAVKKPLATRRDPLSNGTETRRGSDPGYGFFADQVDV
jgi:hypothetical protein